MFLNTPAGNKAYQNCLNKLNNKNPYYTTAFIESFSDGLENLICFQWSFKKQIILLIGYLRPVNDQLPFKDFTSPYGYSGPVFSANVKEQDLFHFWKCVNTWLIAHQVVASFIRFSLNTNTQGYLGKIKSTLLNVKGLIRSEGQQWKNFKPKVRKNVNRAKRESLTVQITRGSEVNLKQLKSFYKIYTTSLSRNSATKSYYSSLKDFKSYCSQEGSSCIFAFVYDGTKMIAAEMVLLSDDSLYSFLGGTVALAFSKRPNDLLKYSLINWARENNYSYFILGGGYGKEDGVFKYKKSFFPNDIVSFYTGRQIFNQMRYKHLCEKNNMRITSEEQETLMSIDFFPAYRYPGRVI